MQIHERIQGLPATPEAFRAELALAREGDVGALDRMARRYYEPIRSAVHIQLATDLRVSRPWLLSRFSTGDIVQEVFDSVLGDLWAFRGTTEDSFCGYLAMIIRNRIIDAIRYHQASCRDGRAATDLAALASIADSSERNPADHAAHRENVELVHHAIATLEERTQLLVRARLENTATFAELTEQLGYGSETSARRAFFDAYAKLAIRLTDFRDSASKDGI